MFLTQPSLGFPSSLSVSQVSEEIDCKQLGRVSFQVTGAGTFSVTAQIEVSNDNLNWVGLGTPTALIVGTIIVEKVDLTTRYCRLSLVRTSGTVTGLSTVFNGKF